MAGVSPEIESQYQEKKAALEKELSEVKKQLEEKNQTITINTFPNFANCNINPETEYHQEKSPKGF